MLDTRYLVAECHTTGRLCELCGAPAASIRIRDTTYGPACLSLCTRCQDIPEPLATRTNVAALDHQAHIIRAHDTGEIG